MPSLATEPGYKSSLIPKYHVSLAAFSVKSFHLQITLIYQQKSWVAESLIAIQWTVGSKTLSGQTCKMSLAQQIQFAVGNVGKLKHDSSNTHFCGYYNKQGGTSV